MGYGAEKVCGCYSGSCSAMMPSESYVVLDAEDSAGAMRGYVSVKDTWAVVDESSAKAMVDARECESVCAGCDSGTE